MSEQYPNREDWLAVRSSPSLGRVLRSRERYVHISVEIIPPVMEGNRMIIPARPSNTRITHRKDGDRTYSATRNTAQEYYA